MPEELVTIAKFFSLGEAKLAQGKLSSEGISAFLCDEHTHAINWHMGAAFGGIRLQVPDSQVIRALEILEGFEPDEPRGRKNRKRRQKKFPAVLSANRLRFAKWRARIRAKSLSGRLPFHFPSLQPRRPITGSV